MSRLIPATSAAAELKNALCPELWMITSGVSATPFSQSSVGSGNPFCSSGSQAIEVGAVGAAAGHLPMDRVDDVIGRRQRHRPDVDHPVRQYHRFHQRMSVRLNETGQHAALPDRHHRGIGLDPVLQLVLG